MCVCVCVFAASPETNFLTERRLLFSAPLAVCQQASDLPLVLVAWQPGAGAMEPRLADDLSRRPRAR